MELVETPDIRMFYQGEDEKFLRDKEFTQILLNGFRENADRFAAVMELVKDLQPKTILDVGCSRGFLGAMYRWQRGYAPEWIEGVDVSPASAAFARDVNGYNHVHCLDASRHFDLKKKFDLVICTELLEHVPEPLVLVANVARHAKDHVLITTPVETDIDGKVHVRHVEVKDLHEWFWPYCGYLRHWFLESKFNEKPHWKGWNFVHGRIHANSREEL